MKKVIHKIVEHKKIAIIVAIITLLVVLLTSTTVIINKTRENKEKQEIQEFEWEIYDVSGKTVYIEAIFRNEDGLKKLTYPEDENTKEIFEVYPNGKGQIAIDLKLQDRVSYEFKLETETGEKKTYTLDCEVPRIKGNYKLVNGIYVNEPDISTGLDKDKTRYLYMDDNQNLVPGNWITHNEPSNWYDYNTQNWANVYTEDGGIENYLVWIPRYMYKVDTSNSVTGNERMDVKFINTYNEYIDGTTGKITTYEELVANGYELPEAFTWQYKETNMNLIIPGYWMSKYQLSDLGNYKINYNLKATKYTFDVADFTNNISTTAVKYTYAINGKIVNESETLSDYSFTNTTSDGNNIINITALNEKGSIVGSMTRQLELVDVNAPDLTGFDPNTTYYVYWDENENEHNEIPISQKAPEDWYNYSYSSWANIVTRNDGKENYLVWIPRYSYSLDQTSQRSNIRFIQGTGTNVEAGYEIPEAFTWVNNSGETVQISGYWMSKYQLSNETTAKVDTEIATDTDTLTINPLTGTLINDIQTNGTNVNYEYYINERKIMTANDGDTETYTFGGLKAGYTYIVNIILRDANTDKYLGAVTKKILITKINKPDLMGFDENMTYYVQHEIDEEGNLYAFVGDKIKNDGSNIPEDWYSYANKIWANIVVTDGQVVDGQIQNATTTNYLVWIPRYQYRLDGTNQRSNIKFIEGTSSQVETGYEIPEAFTWINNNGETVQIPGYWMSKYQLSN